MVKCKGYQLPGFRSPHLAVRASVSYLILLTLMCKKKKSAHYRTCLTEDSFEN